MQRVSNRKVRQSTLGSPTEKCMGFSFKDQLDIEVCKANAESFWKVSFYFSPNFRPVRLNGAAETVLMIVSVTLLNVSRPDEQPNRGQEHKTFTGSDPVSRQILLGRSSPNSGSSDWKIVLVTTVRYTVKIRKIR